MENLKTIIAKNIVLLRTGEHLTQAELAERLNNATDGANLNGSRIFDRLKEICKPILLKGTSRRN